MSEAITKEYFDEQFENLGVMIARGFEETATKADLRGVEGLLGKVEMRLDKVEVRLETVENRLERVENKLDRALYTDMVNLESRVKKLEPSAS